MSKRYRLMNGPTDAKKGTPDGTVYRIKYLDTGVLGGWIQSEDNLDQESTALVLDNAIVSDNARVSGNARVSDAARVFGNAIVSGDARISGSARLYLEAQVYGNSQVYENAKVWGEAQVYGNAKVYGGADVNTCAHVYGNAQLYDKAVVADDAKVYGNAIIRGDAKVSGNAIIHGDAKVSGNAMITDNLVTDLIQPNIAVGSKIVWDEFVRGKSSTGTYVDSAGNSHKVCKDVIPPSKQASFGYYCQELDLWKQPTDAALMKTIEAFVKPFSVKGLGDKDLIRSIFFSLYSQDAFDTDSIAKKYNLTQAKAYRLLTKLYFAGLIRVESSRHGFLKVGHFAYWSPRLDINEINLEDATVFIDAFLRGEFKTYTDVLEYCKASLPSQ